MPTMEGYRYAEDVHERTIDTPTYGCHDHAERVAVPMLTQDGWTPDGRRNMVETTTEWIPDRQCGHDESADDPKCAGCRWRLTS